MFWAGVLPAVVAAPLLLRLLPESPGVLLAKGRTAEADAVADRYGMARPVPADAPAQGARGRLAAILALFRPGARWATPLLWLASFCGLLLVYGVSTWLPQMMRAAGYGLTSSVSFLLIINAGGIVGMLIAGRTADRYGPVKVSALWFLLTAAGALLLGAHLPLGLTYVVVAVTGVWLFSAQVMVYAAAHRVYPAAERATGIGWVTGIGRTGAVAGPWLGRHPRRHRKRPTRLHGLCVGRSAGLARHRPGAARPAHRPAGCGPGVPLIGAARRRVVHGGPRPHTGAQLPGCPVAPMPGRPAHGVRAGFRHRGGGGR